MATDRMTRLLYVLICVAGLGLYVPGFVQQAHQPTLPPALLREALAYPVELGGLRAATAEQLRFLGEGRPVGTTLTLREADGDAREVTLVPRRDRTYLTLAAFGALFFWAMCLFAFTPRLSFPGAILSFWTTFPYGLAVATGGMYFRGDRPWFWSIPGHVHLACLAALPVVFVAMTTSFPARHPVRDRLPWLLPALGALAAGLALWQQWSFETFFRDPGPARAAALALSGRVADFTLVGQVALGVLFLFQQGRAAASPRRREAVRWLFRGFLIGAAPYVFLRTLPTALGFPALLPAAVDRLAELAIPVTFLLVVARHRFLEADVILRRSLIYGVVATIFLVGSAALLLLLRPIPIGLPDEVDSLLWISLGVAVGLLFRPVREAVAEWADRRFFQVLAEHNGELAALERDLTAAVSVDGALRVIASRLRRALEPRELAVLARDGRGVHTAEPGREAEGDALLRAWSANGGGESVPEALRDRFVAAAPLRSGSGPAGVLLLGAHPTGRPWIDRERRLLHDVAERASAHVERISLHRRVDEERAEARRFEELHRAKSEFLSRVSHDLRTPLTSISWSVQNLLDGVVGELDPRQREYVGEIEHSASYLNRLVGNLLRMSRLERGEMDVRATRTDLRDVVRRSVRTIAAAAERADVRLDAPEPDAPVPAWADPHLLEEALVNLLENAVQFSPPGGTVDVRIESGEDGARIRVRDRGPGLPEGGAAALFERYARGPRSPWSSHEGFGLGLSIARAHLEMMSGSLHAGDHPEGGAVFTCRLAPDDPRGIA